jgi:PknH-like protein
MQTAVRWLLVVLCIALAGCSRAVDGAPAPAMHGPASSGVIQPAQLADLLTPTAVLAVVRGRPLSEDNLQAILFIGANPAECHGVVGYGHYPLFPSNYTGREARTQLDNASNQHQLLEVSATYPSDFDAARFLDSIRKTVSGCQHTVTAWADDERGMTVTPTPLLPGSPDVAHWTTNLSGQQWICDFAVIAKANVVSQIETCSPDRSIDIQPLITKRLKEIQQLLNSTA